MDAVRRKVHREFFRVPLDLPAADDLRWRDVAGYEGRISELVLADDFDEAAKRGSRTRLARWRPGATMPQPVIHDFHEEVFLVAGDFVVGCDAEGRGGERFEAYTFACRPPGVWHGPFTTRDGCLLFEIQYFD